MAERFMVWKCHRKRASLPVSSTSAYRRDGETLLTDGPGIKTTGFIAGIDIASRADRQQAIEFAAARPIARYHVRGAPYASPKDDRTTQDKNRTEAGTGAIVKTCGSRSFSGFQLGGLAGPFDQFPVDEGRPGTHERDEVGCVDGTPAVCADSIGLNAMASPAARGARALGDLGAVADRGEGGLGFVIGMKISEPA